VGDPLPVIPRGLATQDLRDAAGHYARAADPATARRFIDAVEQAFTLIARQPGTGSPRYAVDLDLPGLRARPVERFTYLIFYFERTDHIDVVRILHAHRDIPASLQDPAEGT